MQLIFCQESYTAELSGLSIGSVVCAMVTPHEKSVFTDTDWKVVPMAMAPMGQKTVTTVITTLWVYDNCFMVVCSSRFVL